MPNKRDHVKAEYYDRHLQGVTKFAANPVRDRLAIFQRMYVRHLTEISVNRFKWNNVPHTVDVRFMELQLFRSALAVFYYEHDLGRFLALQGSPAGHYDMLDNPTKFRVIGNHFSTKTLSTKLCVPIWANYLRVPDHDIVAIYASKLADIDLTIEINAHNARRNKVLAFNEDMRLTAENVARQMDEGQTIKVNFDLMGSDGSTPVLQAIDLGIQPDTLEKLHILKVRLYNECMEMLGIKTANQDKKERLVADEVDANEESSSATQMVALNERRNAANKINRMFGLNLSVEYHVDAMQQMSSMVLDVPGRTKPDGWPTSAGSIEREDSNG